MPYPRETFFDPSVKYRKSWSLVPQGRTLSLSGQKTGSIYDEISQIIPLYYILTVLAISFDIYLGFAILAKSGVTLMVVVILVLADIFLAIFPYLLANYNKYNYTNVENKIFKYNLECMTKLKKESDDSFGNRLRSNKKEIKKLRFGLRIIKIFKLIKVVLIFAIAFWKIFNYYAVLPTGVSIFSTINGKVVIILSLLCALFHIIATEKTLAHLSFWFKKKEFNDHSETFNPLHIPTPKSIDINFVGKYKNSKYKNTEVIVNEDGIARIEYINIIWDDEIKELMDDQDDEDAKRGVVITCKQKQII